MPSMSELIAEHTDLTDAEWGKRERLLPPEKRGGRPRKHARREIFDAIFYLVRADCHWRLLPTGFPPWKTVYHYCKRYAERRLTAGS